jgi:glycine/D-amino acid oxidase-like deaminating enzyme
LDKSSPFEKTRVLDPAPNKTMNRVALDAMTRLYPQFRQVPIVQEWGGYIDVTPDVVPFISGVGDLPGLTVATGFSGHGFGIGPGAGQLAAELATEEKTSVETTPFRISRFSDGSRIIIGPEI